MVEQAIPWFYLVVALGGAAFIFNAFAPVRGKTWVLIPSFLFSLFAAELAAYHLLWLVVATMVFVSMGALSDWPGWIGLALSAASWVGLFALVVQGHRAAVPIRAALELAIGEVPQRALPWRSLLLPFPLRLSKARVIRNVVYARVSGQALRLDVYLPPDPTGPRPAVVQIHGGAWVVGDKREQGVPLMTRMSDRGWVGFNVNYRLSPGATFPDHLVDIKRAIAWIRGHADAYGVDARFIAVTGGSAGGHLAAMTALTGGDPAFQPGFEDADTRVQAAVPFYGLYDLTDQSKTHARGFMSMLLEPIVLKAFYEDEPDKFRAASPVDQIHPDAPPFFVIHGDRDTMAPLADARVFVEKLRAISRAPVVYAEIRGAQHAFDLLVSPRSLSVIEGVGDWLDFLYHEGAHPIASSTAGPDLESPATARL